MQYDTTRIAFLDETVQDTRLPPGRKERFIGLVSMIEQVMEESSFD